jgi:hypothetical protein
MTKNELEKELHRKRKELIDEENFYRNLRQAPRKTNSDWQALDMSQNTRKKLEEEILELENQIRGK